MIDERWKPIEDYPDYLISDYGRVYNQRIEALMAESRTQQGDLKVTLSANGERVTRSIRVLVADAFVPKPPVADDTYKSSIPDTVIVLDNNQRNVASYNLAWRPRWFAHKYSRQFGQNHPSEYFNMPVKDLSVGVVYNSIVEASMAKGLLFNDVYKSVTMGLKVYPTYSTYVWA